MPTLKRILGVSPNYRLLARAPVIAGRLFGLNFAYFVQRRTPVVVFSMERSGTVALFQSLIAHGAFAIATHYLDPARRAPGFRAGSARWASRHVIRPKRPARIITLVRNPVENMLSVFARRALAPDAELLGWVQDDADQQDVRVLFARRFLDARLYEHQLGWFDTEFRAALGVDVYQHRFDPAAGHARFKDGPFDILVLRTELDDARKSAAVSEFLGLPGFEMIPAAAVLSRQGVDHGRPGEQTAYGAAYRDLKQGLIIPEEHWKNIVESRYARHFCTRQELDDARARFAPPAPLAAQSSM